MTAGGSLSQTGLGCLLAALVFTAPVLAAQDDPAQLAAGAKGFQALPQEQAVDWLKRMAEAPFRVNYEGVFVYSHGESMQTVRVSSRVAGGTKESRLVSMDGTQREIRCTQSGSVILSTDGSGRPVERRFSKRHFPDIFPEQAAQLTAWYTVALGGISRVAGRECRELALIPKDAFRWGHNLCIDQKTHLPLKAVMVNESGRPLMEHTFAEVQIHKARTRAVPSQELPHALDSASLQVRNLPPGFTKIGAMKRKLPNRSDEVEHWVYSDGLTHISLFIEPAATPSEPLKGEGPRGMVNLLTRQVGAYQVTVLGEAPWPAIESIGLGLAERRP